MNAPFLILILLSVDSLHFVFARLLLPHIDPNLSPVFVMLVGSLEVGLFGIFTRRLKLSTLKKNLWGYIAIGFLVGTSMTINYSAVAFIDPGTASLLTETGVLWGLALGIIWLRERMQKPQFLGAAIAIIGVFIISYEPGNYFQPGALMVLASAFMYALHAAVAKKFMGEIDLLNFFFFRLFFIFIYLFTVAAGRGILAWPSPAAWPFILLTGTIDVVFSRLLYYIALRRLKLSFLNIVLTLSPVVTILYALMLFNEAPSSREIIGGVAVILGVMLVSFYRERLAQPQSPRRSS